MALSIFLSTGLFTCIQRLTISWSYTRIQPQVVNDVDIS